MSPKEKAQKLLDTMTKQTYEYQEYAGANYTTYEIGYEGGKKCALIAVIEVINSNPHSNPFNTEPFSTMDYWIDVKNEINKL